MQELLGPRDLSMKEATAALGKANRNASTTTPTTIEEFAQQFARAYQG